MLKPGLSQFDTDTKGAAASLDPLLKIAMDTVPKSQARLYTSCSKGHGWVEITGRRKVEEYLGRSQTSLGRRLSICCCRRRGSFHYGR